jgi:hypothetical protein
MAGAPFVARARRGHALSTPLECPCPVRALGRRPMRPPRAVLVRVRSMDRCISISLHSGTNHARRRYFGFNSLDGTIPAALSALNKLSALCARPARDNALCACVQALSVSTPACARTHRRTAVRVPSPHVAVSMLAAAPCSGAAPWGTRYRWQYPLTCSCSVRPRCECRARPVPLPRADRSTHAPVSTPRVPSQYPASSEED